VDLPADQARLPYARSLDAARGPRRRAGHQVNLILGLGEERHEVTEAMRTCSSAALLTITQYRG
jgi:lipoate synthase